MKTKDLFGMLFVAFLAVAGLTACSLHNSNNAQDLLAKADSCLKTYDYQNALNFYQQAFSMSKNVVPSDVLTDAAVAAAQCDQDSIAIDFLYQAQSNDSEWVSELIPVTELLEDLRLDVRWEPLFAENEARTSHLHPEYDMKLRTQLLELYRSDQNTRGWVVMAMREEPQDEDKIQSRWLEVIRQDSINLPIAVSLLDSCGWIPSSKVGTANQAVFFIIQHASPEIIDRYIGIFEEAAMADELPRDLFAKMYDRQLMYSGKPQKYGTQRVKEMESDKMVLWKLENPSMVNVWRSSMGLAPLSDPEIKLKE